MMPISSPAFVRATNESGGHHPPLGSEVSKTEGGAIGSRRVSAIPYPLQSTPRRSQDRVLRVRQSRRGEQDQRGRSARDMGGRHRGRSPASASAKKLK